MTTTIDRLRTVLGDHKLTAGKHDSLDCGCCALELLSAARGTWTDDPAAVRCIDIRSLNDAPWSTDAERTEHMLPVLAALDGSLDWPAERKASFARQVAVGVVREIVADLPGLPEDVAARCRAADTLDAAARAAYAAARAARAAAYAYRATRATRAATAAVAARAAAIAADRAATRAAADTLDAAARAAYAYRATRAANVPLIAACRILTDAAARSAEGGR